MLETRALQIGASVPRLDERSLSGVDREKGVTARSEQACQHADRTSHLERRSGTRFRYRVKCERVFGALVGTRRKVPRIWISRVECVEMVGLECWAQLAHASLSKKNSYGRSKRAKPLWVNRNPSGSSSMRFVVCERCAAMARRFFSKAC